MGTDGSNVVAFYDHGLQVLAAHRGAELGPPGPSTGPTGATEPSEAAGSLTGSFTGSLTDGCESAALLGDSATSNALGVLASAVDSVGVRAQSSFGATQSPGSPSSSSWNEGGPGQVTASPAGHYGPMRTASIKLVESDEEEEVPLY